MTDQRRKKPGQRARQIDALFVAIAATIAILGVFAREAPPIHSRHRGRRTSFTSKATIPMATPSSHFRGATTVD